MEPRRAQIIAVFARDRDRARSAPHGRLLVPLVRGAVRVSARLAAAAALTGFIVAALATPVLAWVAARVAGEATPPWLVLGGFAGSVGAVLGVLVVRRGARWLERDVNAHLARGRLVALLTAPREDAEDVARRLEAQGALDAIALPAGIAVAGGAAAPIPFRLRGEEQEDEGFGATLVAGDGSLPRAAARIEDAGVRVAFIGRDGRRGPVHSSTAGPAQVGAPRPVAGEGWWRPLMERLGHPIRLALADGELVILGDARRVGLILAAHRNDTVSSALARLADRFGCPDASARIVVDAIDAGDPGIILFGPRDARRLGVERLSAHAVATSEGASARPPLEQAAA
jgi:hypothetical protein